MTDRRTTIKWMLAAAAAMPLSNSRVFGQEITAQPAERGYGSDPDLTKIYHAGDFWPLTLSASQRRTAASLCNVILPDDGRSPSAESVGVVDFIDEWVSAPYEQQQKDQKVIRDGLAWIDGEAKKRFKKGYADCAAADQTAILDDIVKDKTDAHKSAFTFYKNFRD